MKKNILFVMLVLIGTSCCELLLRADTVLALNSNGTSYEYELWLNGEPVIYNNGRATNRWVGWPLLAGANKAEIRVQLMGSHDIVPDISLVIRENRIDKTIIEINERLQNAKTYDIKFELKSPPGFLRAVDGAIIEEQRVLKAALKIINVMASGDNEQVSKLLEVDGKEAKPFFPLWVSASKIASNKLEVHRAIGNSDVICLVGQKLAIVRPALASYESGDRTLVRIEDKPANMIFDLSFLVFSVDKHNRLLLESGPTGSAVRVVE